MSMHLVVSFGLALFVALFRSAFLPLIHLMAFAPFLAIVYQKKGLKKSLLIAFLCGLIMDLITSEGRWGLFSLNFVLTTLLLHRQKYRFFENEPTSLALFTFVISALSTGIQFLLLMLLNRNPPFSKTLLFTDCLVMPLFDALYAVIWFSVPTKLLQYARKGRA